MAVQESEEYEDLRYLRVGHIDQGRFCDQVVKTVSSVLEGELLPARWEMKTPEKFIARFGRGAFWSKTQNYHLFIFDGQPIFRIWTRAKVPYAWVDVTDQLADFLKRKGISVEHKYLLSERKKCKPHTKHFKIETEDQIAILVGGVRYLYGVD